VKLVKSCLEQREVSGQDAEDAVTGIIAFVDLWMKLMSISLPDALLHHLYPNPPSAVLLNYTSQAMSSSIITSRTFVIHLLFLFLEQESLSDAILASISNVILANPTGLEPGDSLPAALEKPFSQTRPVPDIATSTSANPEPSPVITASTLALLLPLLRICSLTASSPAPTPIINFTTRILSLLEPYPAPSLEVGLEAGNLLQSLPEVLAAPLRDCLSGLMADLTISQDVAQLGISSAPPDPVEISNITSVTPKSLTSSHSSPLLPQIFEFLLSYLLRSARWTRCPEYASEPPRPPDTHIKLLRLGPHIASDPSTFLLHLIQTAVNDWGGTYKGGSPEGVPSWLFLTEGLPVLLRWWRDNSDPKWPFPVSPAHHP